MKLVLLVVLVAAAMSCAVVHAEDACFLSGGVCTLNRYAQCFRKKVDVLGTNGSPTSTGAFLTRDTDVVLTAEGVVNICEPCGPSLMTNADGPITPSVAPACVSSACKNSTVPQGLLYRIGTGPWQLAGSSIRVHDGSLVGMQELFLIFNDGIFSDNSGKYTVDVQVCDEEPRALPAGYTYSTAWNIVASPVSAVVPANQGPNGTNSGVRLDGNTEVTMSARGTMNFCGGVNSQCNTNPEHTLAGSAANPCPTGCALEGAEVGALLYRFGTDPSTPWSLAGASKVIRGTGTKKQDLYFLVNDLLGTYSDNTGSYSVYMENLRERCPQNKCSPA